MNGAIKNSLVFVCIERSLIPNQCKNFWKRRCLFFGGEFQRLSRVGEVRLWFNIKIFSLRVRVTVARLAGGGKNHWLKFE